MRRFDYCESCGKSPDLLRQKRLSRYLIDQKIPQNKREDAWVLCDENETILALLPYMLSYLSIPKETDKIHYVLLYKYQK